MIISENISFILPSLLPILLGLSLAAEADTKYELATFAGGCFWCIEPPFEKLTGVIEVKAGYTGGTKANPTYEEVCSGSTGHLETVQVKFDPAKISYQELLEVFWEQIDPTDAGGQFADRGSQYKTAILYHGEEQKKIAEKSREALDKSGKYGSPIATVIKKAGEFYNAEDYHQDYYKKCPLKYKAYKQGSGRESFIEKNRGIKK